MESLNIEFVDTVFRVEYCHETIKIRFRDYLTDKPADFTLRTTPEEQEEERRIFLTTPDHNGAQRDHVSDEMIEFLNIHRHAARDLLQRGVLLLHGSAVASHGDAYLFVAPSGTGKSTHTRMWLDLPDADAFILNDDKPMLRPGENGVTIFATPWGLTAKPQQECVPLRAIILLERGDNNEITPMSPAGMFPPLYPAAYRGETAEEAKRALDLLSQILSSVKLFRLRCNTQPEAAQIAYRTLSTC